MAIRPEHDQDKIEFSFSAIKATQPIGDLYLASIPWRILEKISYFDVRRVIQEERDVERYLGIQRPLNVHRENELKKYVNFSDATFPTSVIIAVSDEFTSYDDLEKKMTIRNFQLGDDAPSKYISHSARVIDGQHRIAGLNAFQGQSFDVPTTVFVGSDVADQAYVFATVNLEQTKVSKSLAYDLYELARTRSPQRTCHEIAVALDSDTDSPLFQRIKRLGIATPGRDREFITQATFVESLMRYISVDAKVDRDLLMRGKSISLEQGRYPNDLVFRRFFVEEKDVQIASVVFNFFHAIRSKWQDGWNTFERGIILNRTNGFRAFMRLLGPLYKSIALPGTVVKAEAFFDALHLAPADFRYFSTDRYQPGTSGESELFSDLKKWTKVS